MPLLRSAASARSLSLHEQDAAELRRNRCALFIQQFEKEAQERMSEMEARMANMLTTVDKFFNVELMKMPPALQKTFIADLINEEVPSSDVSIALKNDSPEIHKPLKRVSSRKAKFSQNSPVEIIHGPKSSAKTTKGLKGTKKKALVGSHSAGDLGSTSSLPVKRTLSRVVKGLDQATKTRAVLRSVSSTGDICSVVGCSPHISITTSQGQRFCLSEETKDTINVDMLDDIAMFQIQRLMNLMDYLSSKAKFRD